MGFFPQHGENLQVVMWQQAPTSLSVLGYPWVSCSEELPGVRVPQRSSLGQRAGLGDGLYSIAFQFRFELNSGSRSVGQFGDLFELTQKRKKNLVLLEVQSRP